MLRKKITILIFLSLLYCDFFSQSDTTKTTATSTNTTNEQNEPLPPQLGDIYKPTIGLGVGMLSYYGDLYSKHMQSFTTARVAYELMLSQPLSKSFYLNFYGLFGKLGANEHLGTRNENFQSEIRLGGIHLLYDFSNFIPTYHTFRPWISTGVEGFEFLSKTDLYDKDGQKYYYWADGSIKNMAETNPNSSNAIDLVRDYNYETDIRTLNADGFGKYQERSWAIPVGAGFIIDINQRAKFKIGTTFHFSFTDYIDGVSNKSTGNRMGNKAKDNFVMSSFSLHYDLVVKKKTTLLPEVDYDNTEIYAFEKDDEDGDGVTDFKDDCHKTPKGAKVDSKGCPVDEDKDRIGDCYDKELPTPEGMIVNGLGIAITDEMAQLWYDTYYDSTGLFTKNLDLDSAKKPTEKYADLTKLKKEYTVELARFAGGVPADIMVYILSIGDVTSTQIGDTVVIYTSGSYEDVRLAIQRRDEFIAEGIKDAKVGYFLGRKYFLMDNGAVVMAKEIEISDSLLALKKGTTTPLVKNSNDTTSISITTTLDTTVASTNPTIITKQTTTSNTIIYRVQLGAYKNPLSKSLFKKVGKVIELKTNDGYYKYVTDAYPSLEKAMVTRAELVLEGYTDAFVAAYKQGKRISLHEAGATFDNMEDAKTENLDESKNKSGALDKSFVVFKIQVGGLKKSTDTDFEEHVKTITNIEKTVTTTGLIRFTSGEFSGYTEAVKAKTALAEQGFNDSFVIATFNGELISIQEALEILGGQK